MSKQVDDLLKLLKLDHIDKDLFLGQSRGSLWQRVFGGHILAQSLVAAQNSVEEVRYVHSMHAYFMLPGNPNHPIMYHVTRLRDGRSFSTRQVMAYQNDQIIFTMTASFQINEPGLEHYIKMPDTIPMPEDIIDDPIGNDHIIEKMPKAMQNYWRFERPFILKPVSLTHYISSKKLPPYHGVWIKLRDKFAQNSQLNAALLSYISDATLLDTALFAHGLTITDPTLQVASLDHALWFHRPVNFNDWLFYYQDNPNTNGARGLSRGLIYNKEGVLIATSAQEGLIRQIS